MSKNRKSFHRKRVNKRPNVAALRLRYKFLILVGVLILAGIAIVIKTESPSVWTFLYGIGGWAALTTHSLPKV